MTELASPAATEVRPRRFTSDEVQAMLEAGILHEDDPLELVDGQLVVMSPINDPHIVCTNRLNRLFVERTTPDVAVNVQNPVRIDAHNEPEPDVVLSTNLEGAPRPDDVLLLVEVSDTAPAYDRDVKRPLYARAGIPEVWILDLEAEHLEVHRAPDEDVHRTRHLAGLDDTVTPKRPASIDAVPVRNILGDLPDNSRDSASDADAEANAA
ncbi:MAG: Uma2 family endonuclease [Salinibacter sp.]